MLLSLLLLLLFSKKETYACLYNKTNADWKKVQYCCMILTCVPSSDHVIWGKGLPEAAHFNETDDPGSTVTFSKVCKNCGGLSSKEKRNIYVWIPLRSIEHKYTYWVLRKLNNLIHDR